MYDVIIIGAGSAGTNDPDDDAPLVQTPTAGVDGILEWAKVGTVLVWPAQCPSTGELTIYLVVLTKINTYDTHNYIEGRFLYKDMKENSTHMYWTKKHGEEVVKIFDELADDSTSNYELAGPDNMGEANAWYGAPGQGSFPTWKRERYMAGDEYEFWVKHAIGLGWDELLCQKEEKN